MNSYKIETIKKLTDTRSDQQTTWRAPKTKKICSVSIKTNLELTMK